MSATTASTGATEPVLPALAAAVGPLRPDGLHAVKAHGTGNDFVVLLDPDGSFPVDASLAAALCDRRRGLGGDGLIRVVRAEHADRAERVALEPVARVPLERAHGDRAGTDGWFMDYRNADGSLAEMCGNGVRVLAHVLRAAGLVDPAGRELVVETRAGVRPVRVVADGYPVYAVDMGPAVAAEAATTVTVTMADGSARRLPGLAVDVGNPHVVVEVGDLAALAAADLGRRPDLDPDPAAGANVELVAPVPAGGRGASLGAGSGGGHVRARIHERGVGETLSCGTGAVAVAAAGAARSGGRLWTVDVPGGRLQVRLQVREGTVVGSELAGPAEIVGHVVVPHEWLARATETPARTG